MKPFLDMITSQICLAFSQYIIQLFIFGIIVSFMVFFIEKIGVKNIIFGIQKKLTKESDYKWKILFYTYFYFILKKSLLDRSMGIKNSLEFAFKSDWLFLAKDTWSRVQSIANILFFIPLSIFFILAFFKSKDLNLKLLKMIIKFSFLLSFLIELSQLILTLGTFQLSDIVYNILGGIIGWILVKGLKNLKKIKTNIIRKGTN